MDTVLVNKCSWQDGDKGFVEKETWRWEIRVVGVLTRMVRKGFPEKRRGGSGPAVGMSGGSVFVESSRKLLSKCWPQFSLLLSTALGILPQ